LGDFTAEVPSAVAADASPAVFELSPAAAATAIAASAPVDAGAMPGRASSASSRVNRLPSLPAEVSGSHATSPIGSRPSASRLSSVSTMNFRSDEQSPSASLNQLVSEGSNHVSAPEPVAQSFFGDVSDTIQQDTQSVNVRHLHNPEDGSVLFRDTSRRSQASSMDSVRKEIQRRTRAVIGRFLADITVQHDQMLPSSVFEACMLTTVLMQAFLYWGGGLPSKGVALGISLLGVVVLGLLVLWNLSRKVLFAVLSVKEQVQKSFKLRKRKENAQNMLQMVVSIKY
jgi:hypothetical protein